MIGPIEAGQQFCRNCSQMRLKSLKAGRHAVSVVWSIAESHAHEIGGSGLSALAWSVSGLGMSFALSE